MSLLKSILFISLFCLLLCSTELYALGSDELKSEKQEATLSLNGIGKALDGTVKALGKSLNGTVDGIGKSVNGTVKDIGKSLNGTVKGIGESIDETLYGFGEFLEENGEGILIAGATIFYFIAESYCYDSGYGYGYDNRQGYNHNCNRW
jgi:hypothetical protein